MHSEHHENIHSASPEELQPVADNVSPGLVRAKEWALALGNAVVSVPEFTAAVVRKAGIAGMDSLHNWFDFLGYLKQLRLISMSGPEGQEVLGQESRFKMWGSVKRLLAQSNHHDEAKLEKSSFALISLPAIGAAALAGAGLVSEVVGSSTNNDGVEWTDMAHFGAAGAALALAGGLWHAGRRMVHKVSQTDNPSPKLSRHVNNFYAHAKLDAASSGAAVAESLIHMAGSGVWVVNLGVLAISGYQVWRFWPTRAGKQLPHDHESAHSHAHEHHDGCDHAHLVSHEAMEAAATGLRRLKSIGGEAMRSLTVVSHMTHAAAGRGQKWLTGVAYKPRHKRERQEEFTPRSRVALGLGAAALVLGAGLVNANVINGQSQDAAPTVPRLPAADSQSNATNEQPRIPEAPATSECVTIRPGDSQWNIVKRRISKATGERPSVAATNAIMMFTAVKNQHTNPAPDKIRPGECLSVPTIAATRLLNTALTQPDKSDPKLAAAIGSFNEQPNLQAVLENNQAKAPQIDSYLRLALTR